MPGGPVRSRLASLQYRADNVPSCCHERPLTSRPPARSREMRRRLTAEGSSSLRALSEYCHQSPSIRASRPSASMALRTFWLTSLSSAGVRLGG